MRALLILAVASCAVFGQTPASKTPAKTAPAKAAGTPAKGGAAPAKTGTPAAKTGAAASSTARLMNPAALRAKAPELYRVKFTTTKGDFVVEVNRAMAPNGADRFWNLVRNRFFNEAAFYRFVPNFMVQFGIPANPAVTAAWEKATFPDDPVKQGNKKGTITFAHTGNPNSRGTQLFINLKDNAFLDSQNFPSFGTVTEGVEIVEGLYSGYGEMKEQGGSGPSQTLATTQGKAYLDKSFPKLDRILSTTVIFPEAPAPPPPAKKASPPAATKKTTLPPVKK